MAANSERRLINSEEKYKHKVSDIVYENVELKLDETPDAEALIIYNASNEQSGKLEKNSRIVLDDLRMKSTSTDIKDMEAASIKDYDLVILACGKWESELGDFVDPIIEYVEQGGRLLIGTLVEETGEHFSKISEILGIREMNGYINFSKIQFEKELAPGMIGMTFEGDSFYDACIDLKLEKDCDVSLMTEVESRSIPIAWTRTWKDGRVSVYNGTGISGDYWRGVLCGCINSLYDTTIYPIINASCLFIDDFPSPQYENESEITMEQYNRSVKEFYRDIWWPEMQIAGSRFEDVYTGLFIATYNDHVDPEQFGYAQTSMEQYYGNSLLGSGHEMGAHGYNHQSLTLKGGTPEELKYVPWADQDDMTASLDMLEEIQVNLFPYVTFKTYVPPSNYLSDEGRRAVKLAFPEIKVISGLLTDEDSEGMVCVQEFGTGEDDVVDFPRITSGMIFDNHEMFAAINGYAAYGVFSHFIHPDDWMDPLRSKGLTWEKMYKAYCEGRKTLKDRYPYIRSLAASEAADAVRVWEMMDPRIEMRDDYLLGSIENFCGEAFFYLKTDKIPQIVDNSCEIKRVSESKEGCYYFVTVDEANFKIKLLN